MKTLMRKKNDAGRPERIFPAAIALAAVLALAMTPPQARDRSAANAVWSDFIAWFRTAAADSNPLAGYAAKLSREGVAEEEAARRIALIVRLFSERPEGAEVYYDRVFSRPLTGRPEQGYPTEPSPFVVETVKGLRPGAALDVGMGQGRNAVYLAGLGWDVTGFDVSGAALDAARANADKASVSIKTEKASYDTFDFGTARWDLIVIIFAWAPVSDPSFVERIRTSLRPGGRILFEHFVDKPDQPHAPMVRALNPDALWGYFAGFRIESYEEADGIGDRGGPGERLVRMVAQKR